MNGFSARDNQSIQVVSLLRKGRRRGRTHAPRGHICQALPGRRLAARRTRAPYLCTKIYNVHSYGARGRILDKLPHFYHGCRKLMRHVNDVYPCFSPSSSTEWIMPAASLKAHEKLPDLGWPYSHLLPADCRIHIYLDFWLVMFRVRSSDFCLSWLRALWLLVAGQGR